MDAENSGFLETCICGRSFTQHSAYNYHRRNCKRGKKRLSEALAKAKEFCKRRKTHEPDQGHSQIPQAGKVPLDAVQHANLVVRQRAILFYAIFSITLSVGPSNG
jgi:hypothetical protein